MKLHMLMLMNAWIMLVLMKCKCQMKCLTLGCYRQEVQGGSFTSEAGEVAIALPPVAKEEVDDSL